MDNNGSTSAIAQTPVSVAGKGRADLKKSDFDALVQQKGYDVWHDKSHKCPCRNVSDNNAQSSCKNCGGSGWIFVNRTETKMIIQSQNMDTKHKEWSQEKIGNAKVTAFNESKLTYMDRITVRNALMVSSEMIHFKKHDDDKYRASVRFDIKAIEVLYLFKSVDEKLQVLNASDYEIKDTQWVELSDDIISLFPVSSEDLNLSVSIRYEHNPQYHVMDITRQVIESYVKKKTTDLEKDVSDKFPISATARLANYVINQEHYLSDYLLDNNFTTACDANLVEIIKPEILTPSPNSGSNIRMYSLDEVWTGLLDYDNKKIYVSGEKYENVVSDQILLFPTSYASMTRIVDSRVTYKFESDTGQLDVMVSNYFDPILNDQIQHNLVKTNGSIGTVLWFTYYTKD